MVVKPKVTDGPPGVSPTMSERTQEGRMRKAGGCWGGGSRPRRNTTHPSYAGAHMGNILIQPEIRIKQGFKNCQFFSFREKNRKLLWTVMDFSFKKQLPKAVLTSHPRPATISTSLFGVHSVCEPGPLCAHTRASFEPNFAGSFNEPFFKLLQLTEV